MVIADFQLPYKDGIYLISELRKLPQMRYVPIIMLTSFATPASAMRAIKAGADDHIRKSHLTNYQLVEVVRNCRRNKYLEEMIDIESGQYCARKYQIVMSSEGV